MDSTILKKAQDWAQNPVFDPEFRKEIQDLIDQKNEKELTERFYKDLEFGTGGLRSILGAGANRMNTYTLRRAAHAVALEVKNTFPTEEHKIAISYDSRRKSFELAKEAARVFCAHGIQSFIYSRLNPVPLLSYSVRYHGAQAGVMVTASHNPKEYNGFKVYWNDGAQVTPPNDKNIIDHYYKAENFAEIPLMDFAEAEKQELIHWVDEEVENAYQKDIFSSSVNEKLCFEHGHELKIVYSPIHGTGLVPCTRALENLGFTDVHIVAEQSQPNSEFPTVKSPNPENPEALTMAIDLMKKLKADLAMASDPDGDRLGVAFQDKGETIFLNGNQIGTLMLYYILESKKRQNQLPKNGYFVKSIVTTPLQEKIAKSYGLKTYNTLTGFKWICGKMNELERTSPNEHFVFATEESFGYLNHPYVRDKDGVSSVALMAEMTLWFKTQGKTLIEGLDEIYAEFGFAHETLLSLDYFGIEGAQKISRIMDSFRKFKGGEFASCKITATEDYQSLEKVDYLQNKTSPLAHAKSNVLGFYLETGDIVFLRPSGTEPKIKFYIMIQESHGGLTEKRTLADKRTKEYLGFIQKIVDQA